MDKSHKGRPARPMELPVNRPNAFAPRAGAGLAALILSALHDEGTGAATWQALVESRRNRRDEWYVHPAGHVDVCNLTVPVRAVERKPAAP